MLQETALRLRGLSSTRTECIVVCNEAHRFLVAEQLRSIDQSSGIILEPEGRNTAPAAALAAIAALKADKDAVLLVMPADHVIPDIAAFQAAVRTGYAAAGEDKLVTFGIVPTHAETGFGYVEATPSGAAAVPVKSFVEKPDQKTAEAYVKGGQHFWNSGMFLFKAATYLEVLSEFAPEMHAACERSMAAADNGADFQRPDAKEFGNCPSDSIDYAVMEKTDNAMMVPLDAGWNDVGSWAALQSVRPRDENGNVVDGDVVLHDCKNSIVQAENLLVAVVGLDDAVVVQTKDSVLVAPKSRSQDVKAVVDTLKAADREETRLHRQVFRPWGSYDSLENMEGFQVKRLIVNPGAVLSLQKHAHRAEHWVVVQGQARITKNDDEFDLAVNESTYIAIGDIHRIANPFDEPAHIIEVQCGDYLGEDDIVRLEDNYGREGTNT